jgi:hypothetical protein
VNKNRKEEDDVDGPHLNGFSSTLLRSIDMLLLSFIRFVGEV